MKSNIEELRKKYMDNPPEGMMQILLERYAYSEIGGTFILI